MIVINFRKWSSLSGRWFIRERLYKFGKWTPLCRIKLRYLKTILEMHKSIDNDDNEIYECS